ncbi:MAG: hypothetical protein NT062_22680, partial [Proteobacteria bacterium]|nr:hypothetical protein [Pseudomonadota bacterium]
MRRWILAFVLTTACAKGGEKPTVDAVEVVDSGPLAPDAPACDGLPCDAVYVSTLIGTDFAAGTKEAPLKTITEGIAKAATTSPAKAVFVRGGTYHEAIVMHDGVGVYGGFDETWTRQGQLTEIVGPSPAVTFDALPSGGVIDGFTIKSDDATAAGGSSIAVYVHASKLIEIRKCTIEPGAGAAGLDGTDGGNGGIGFDGVIGQAGREDSSSIFCASHGKPGYGVGGTSQCNRTGGRGGYAGHASGTGEMGQPGAGGTSGGAPGATQVNGAVGAAGSPGSPGGNGDGGKEVGVFNGLAYEVSSGIDGTSGGDGDGGGGGGGGGGGTTDCDSWGSTGGGGGGGGCGGTRGTAGTGGGGSFGVIAVDATVTLRSTTVLAGIGGAGGRG